MSLQDRADTIVIFQSVFREENTFLLPFVVSVGKNLLFRSLL